LGKHIAAGAIYVSNFILKGESGYFDTAAELKPLLHLWSLGIEEQFYLIWPLLLIVGLRANLNPLVIILFVLIISFSLNVTYIDRLPTHVFYLPISRAWELLIGSTLGYINLYKRHDFDRIASRILLRNPHQIGNHLANIFAWMGVALIALAMMGLSKSRGFPGWWALIPTIGAVLLIAAGGSAWLNRKILARKPVVYMGLISYPLYLWHWPLLSFARIVENDNPSVLIRSSVIVISILLAWGTYWLIERRFRFRQQEFVATGLFVTLGIVGALGYQVYLQIGYGERYPHAERMAENFSWDTAVW
jgi:peptidoglycan/LPS O-acetylase OafA/YrhL